MTLSQEDITACREAFDKFDKDGSGTVRVARARPATASQSARCEPFLVPGVPSLAFSTPRLTPSRTPQIDASELKATLNAMGQNPTEEEIFQMISQVDDDNSGEIEFAEFMKVIENQKASAAKASDETDTIEAFVALGGNADKTGEISTEKLRAVVKVRAR
jgi:calmodulin